MPEGDTIWRTAAALSNRLKGERVEGVRPPSLGRLQGATVTAVEAVGKHLLIRFDSGLSLHSHMRMTGSWHLYNPGQAWRRPAWQAKAVLETRAAVAVCFSAPVIELVADPGSRVGHLGPDILSEEFDLPTVLARARELGAVAIGEVLLDQRVSAGIGNVYRCEALWQARLNPWTPASGIGDPGLAQLYEVARAAMRANLEGGFERRFPGYGKGAVHGRGGRPCRRCGTRIQVRAQGRQARLTYWCPTCQPPSH